MSDFEKLRKDLPGMDDHSLLHHDEHAAAIVSRAKKLHGVLSEEDFELYLVGRLTVSIAMAEAMQGIDPSFMAPLEPARAQYKWLVERCIERKLEKKE
jgi:hypothetical protein